MAAKQTTERLFYTTEFDSLFMQGLCHLHADSLMLAQESFKKCQKLESKSAVVAYQLANISAMKRDTTTAIKLLKKAVRYNKSNYFYYSTLAEWYTAINDYKAATKIYQTICKKFPDKEYPLYMLSRCYLQLGDYAKSIKTYEQLETRIGVTAEMSLEKAYVMALQGNWDGMKREFERIHQKFPLNDDLYLREGAIWQTLAPDKPQLAIACYEKALELNADNIDALRYLCDMYERTGNTAQLDAHLLLLFGAKEVSWEEKMNLLKASMRFYQVRPDYKQIIETIYQKILLADERNEQAWLLYSDFLLQQERYEDAKTALQTCTSLLPTCASCHRYLVNVIMAEQDNQKALEYIDKALQELPGDAYFLTGKAAIYYDEKKDWKPVAEAAIANLTADTAPMTRYTTCTTLSGLYGMEEDYEKSAMLLEMILEEYPDDALIHNNYAYYLALLNKDLDKAEAISAKTIKAEPLNCSYLHTYGYILMLQGKLTYAKFYMHQAIEYDKEQQHFELYHDYGKLLQKLGEEEKANEMLKIAETIKNKNQHENMENHTMDGGH